MNAVGYQLISLYRLIGPTAFIVILVMFIVEMARMLLDILVRAVIRVRVRGCGFWMFGALWDTAFQVAVSPFRWAVEKGKEGAGRIRNQMEARAADAGVAQGGESPENLEILADWATSWRRRVYGVMSLANPEVDARPVRDELRVGGVDLPTAGEAPQPSTESRITVGEMQVRFGYSCSAAGECAAESCFLSYTAENGHHLTAKIISKEALFLF